MIKYIKKQAGSMAAEIAAIIAAIGILTLIGTSYYSLVIAKEQITEGFIISQPLINQVNNFYAGGGVIGTNYLANDIATNTINNRAGRYIQSAITHKNGVVHVTFNPSMAISEDEETGDIESVHAILAGKEMLFVPFYATEDTSNPAPFLRWACMTNINSDLASGNLIDSWVDDATSNPANGFSEGCLVISDSDVTSATDITTHAAPNDWKTYPAGAFN